MFGSGKPLPQLAAIAGALWLGGCIEADKAGTPHLVSFDPIDSEGSAVVKDPDAGVFVVSPRVTFTAVFTDLLDFSLFENVDAGMGKPGLVTIQAAGDPVATTVYTPNGHHKFTLIYPKGPNIAATPTPGLPSGASVVVTLNTINLKGHNGQPLLIDQGAATTLMFQTSPFAVEGETSDMPFAADHAFVVTASNITSEAFASKMAVTATVGETATPVEATITVSEEDPAKFLVAPKEGMWPAGAKVTVTVAADAADQFGVALGQPASIDFMVAAP